MLDRREFLIGSPAAAVLARQASAQTRTRIRRLDIVHHCHTDVGYTDLPSEARDLQRRYIDVAVDACLADKNFRWTVEVIMNFDDWWRASTTQRRKTMLDLIHAGRIDVMALPLNQTSVMNALQWRRMLSWIPDSLWRDIAPRAFMQSDVNGMPRSGAMLLLDRGISRMLMGINSDSGGPPFRRPSAFWWKMPDGRRMFVWLGEHYGVAQRYLKIETAVPDSSEASLRASHASLLENLAKLEKEGYAYDRLLLSYTNPLRWDNGPPVPGVAPFVQAWNKLGLEPELRLTTGTQSLLELEKELGGSLRTLEGEWTDWWLNGTASGPREVAASRFAKRYLTAALSPVWGDMPARAKPSIDTILDDLCIFDEHTWGAHSSVSDPDGLFSVGQYAEKSVLAYRPMSQAGQLLARRARAKLDPLPEGVYVANTAPEPASGWAVVSAPTLKAARSLRDRQSGAAVELRKQGDTQGRIWVEKLPGRSVRAFDITAAEAKEESQPASSPAKTDANGWPVSIQWPGMTKPLTAGALGDFLSVGVIPPADRRTIWQMHATPEEDKREELRAKSLERIAATFTAAESAETAHTWTYKQEFRHPRLAKAARNAGTLETRAARTPERPLRPRQFSCARGLLPRIRVPRRLSAAAVFLRRPSVHALSRPVGGDLPRLLRHRRVGALPGARGRLAVGQPRRAARRRGRAAHRSASSEGAGGPPSPAGHGIRQLLAHQLRRRQQRRHGVSVRPGVESEDRRSGRARRNAGGRTRRGGEPEGPGHRRRQRQSLEALASSGGPEALYHWMGRPGSSVQICVSFCSRISCVSCPGVPASVGNVPKCIGTTFSGWSREQARAASFGPIV